MKVWAVGHFEDYYEFTIDAVFSTYDAAAELESFPHACYVITELELDELPEKVKKHDEKDCVECDVLRERANFNKNRDERKGARDYCIIRVEDLSAEVMKLAEVRPELSNLVNALGCSSMTDEKLRREIQKTLETSLDDVATRNVQDLLYFLDLKIRYK